MLCIFGLHLYALRGQFLPCFLHGIGRKKELAVLRIDLDVACYVTKLLRHDVYRLSCLVELCYASISKSCTADRPTRLRCPTGRCSPTRPGAKGSGRPGPRPALPRWRLQRRITPLPPTTGCAAGPIAAKGKGMPRLRQTLSNGWCPARQARWPDTRPSANNMIGSNIKTPLPP